MVYGSHIRWKSVISDLIWSWLPAEFTPELTAFLLLKYFLKSWWLGGRLGPWSSQSWRLAQRWHLSSWEDNSQTGPLTFHQMKRSLDAGKCFSSHLRCSQFSRGDNHLREGSAAASRTLTLMDPHKLADGVTFYELYDANVSSVLCESWRGLMSEY